MKKLYCYLVSFSFSDDGGRLLHTTQEVSQENEATIGFGYEFAEIASAADGINNVVITSVFPLARCAPEEWEKYKLDREAKAKAKKAAEYIKENNLINSDGD